MTDKSKPRTLGTYALGAGMAEKAAKKHNKRMQQIEEATGRRGRKERQRKDEQ